MHNYSITKLFLLIIFINLKLIINQEEKQKYIEGYITPPIKVFGALEAGGTKMVCAIVDDFGNIMEEAKFPTTTPEETTSKMLEFFKKFEISALGIGTFGPIDLNPKSPTYGSILNTPKLAWKGFNYLTAFKSLNVPIGIDTDVNASCLGETAFGTSRGLSNVIYITIGTGIGVGILSEGQLVHGMMHPEGGHILLEKRENDKGECICPYHDRCFEGLASGPSILKRYGKPGNELVNDEKVWDLEAEYISQALVNYIMVLQPQKIILGGGVMHQESLFPLIRKKVAEKINTYLITKELENLDDYIVPCSLDDKQGILGSFKIALDKYNEVFGKSE
jgi:fructokinase